MSVYDLHCHSDCSDGALSPEALVQRAAEFGVTHLALTDHDTINGVERAQKAAQEYGIDCISGVEFSCLWRNRGIHIVGLNLNSAHQPLHQATQFMAQQRQLRALEIDRQLAKLGFHNSLIAAQELANGGQVGRPHFAQHLVKIGAVKNIAQAFKRYLGNGKVGDIKQQWPDLADVTRWVVEAGGVAVIAHPLKYQLTRTKLLLLCADFQAAGGTGIEVISGGDQTTQQTNTMIEICHKTNMLGSIGSDFHAPDMPWQALGRCGQLPDSVVPVWSKWT